MKRHYFSLFRSFAPEDRGNDALHVSLSCSKERGLCAVVAGGQQRRVLLVDVEDEEEDVGAGEEDDQQASADRMANHNPRDGMSGGEDQMDEDLDAAQQKDSDAAEKLAAEMKMCESFVMGMLRARGQLALDVIHNNLKVSVACCFSWKCKLTVTLFCSLATFG